MSLKAINELELDEFQHLIKNLVRADLEVVYIELVSFYHDYKSVSASVFNNEIDTLALEFCLISSKTRITEKSDDEVLEILNVLFLQIKRVQQEIYELIHK